MKTKWVRLGLCVALAAAGCAGGGRGPSDEELIRGVINDSMAALVAKDVDKMLTAYAADFKNDQGMDLNGFKEFLNGAKEGGALDGMTSKTDEMTITVEGDTAKAAPVSVEGSFGALTFELQLAKRDGKWVIVYQGAM